MAKKAELAVNIVPVDPRYPIKYNQGAVPANYICGVIGCGGTGGKLWCFYAEGFVHQMLFCARCIIDFMEIEGATLNRLDPDGKFTFNYNRHTMSPSKMPSDAVDVFVPAIPDPKNTKLYRYSMIPDIAYAWWRALPNYSSPTRTPV